MPAAITVFTFHGAPISQNPASILYFGDRGCRGDAAAATGHYCAAPLLPPQQGVATAQLTAAYDDLAAGGITGDGGGMSLLQQVFMFEPEKLERMLAELLREGGGGFWKGVLRVPHSVAEPPGSGRHLLGDTSSAPGIGRRPNGTTRAPTGSSSPPTITTDKRWCGQRQHQQPPLVVDVESAVGSSSEVRRPQQAAGPQADSSAAAAGGGGRSRSSSPPSCLAQQGRCAAAVSTLGDGGGSVGPLEQGARTAAAVMAPAASCCCPPVVLPAACGDASACGSRAPTSGVTGPSSSFLPPRSAASSTCRWADVSVGADGSCGRYLPTAALYSSQLDNCTSVSGASHAMCAPLASSLSLQGRTSIGSGAYQPTLPSSLRKTPTGDGGAVPADSETGHTACAGAASAATVGSGGCSPFEAHQQRRRMVARSASVTLLGGGSSLTTFAGAAAVADPLATSTFGLVMAYSGSQPPVAAASAAAHEVAGCRSGGLGLALPVAATRAAALASLLQGSPRVLAAAAAAAGTALEPAGADRSSMPLTSSSADVRRQLGGGGGDAAAEGGGASSSGGGSAFHRRPPNVPAATAGNAGPAMGLTSGGSLGVISAPARHVLQLGGETRTPLRPLNVSSGCPSAAGSPAASAGGGTPRSPVAATTITSAGGSGGGGRATPRLRSLAFAASLVNAPPSTLLLMMANASNASELSGGEACGSGQRYQLGGSSFYRPHTPQSTAVSGPGGGGGGAGAHPFFPSASFRRPTAGAFTRFQPSTLGSGLGRTLSMDRPAAASSSRCACCASLPADMQPQHQQHTAAAGVAGGGGRTAPGAAGGPPAASAAHAPAISASCMSVGGTSAGAASRASSLLRVRPSVDMACLARSAAQSPCLQQQHHHQHHHHQRAAAVQGVSSCCAVPQQCASSSSSSRPAHTAPATVSSSFGTVSDRACAGCCGGRPPPSQLELAPHTPAAGGFVDPPSKQLQPVTADGGGGGAEGQPPLLNFELVTAATVAMAVERCCSPQQPQPLAQQLHSSGGPSFTYGDDVPRWGSPQNEVEEDGEECMEEGGMTTLLTTKDAAECWHEVWASRAVDLVTGQDVIVLTQHDVSAKVVAERHLANVMEAEHRLLEQLFPKHILTHITEEWTQEAERAAAGLAGQGDGGGGPVGSFRKAGAAGGGPNRNLRWRPVVKDCNALATWHPEVTLLFADIQGFTPMCKEVSPRAVMTMLNDLFSRFDAMLDDFGVFKVETIGDCYFVAGGLIHEGADGMAAVRDGSTKADPLHANKVFMFAKAMLAAAREVKMPSTGEPVQIRIGISSGPVVSGVVGTRMPRFCLFGDTVNTTSRMESTGVPGAIHASESAYQLLRAEAWQPTGGIEVKGKGVMPTYLWRPAKTMSGGTEKATTTQQSCTASSSTALAPQQQQQQQPPSESSVLALMVNGGGVGSSSLEHLLHVDRPECSLLSAATAAAAVLRRFGSARADGRPEPQQQGAAVSSTTVEATTPPAAAATTTQLLRACDSSAAPVAVAHWVDGTADPATLAARGATGASGGGNSSQPELSFVADALADACVEISLVLEGT
ncbi:hypothetical protein HYH02_007739 [Chlamydomonas schloesseri]|uniref:Guanylate cyclase domain-containing protein n=1 Tax=Chlamydomonas schloesseri TaxID=2026947 RepID=A0A836B4K2_9CHLO|nr:hypothetical protein HYH02_007739 [Chlamydomonas schloesseri]|eukprot:KAG2447412.1 hypothetical protein HYH02_007739 [Chlamydomonas schloesseri]